MADEFALGPAAVRQPHRVPVHLQEAAGVGQVARDLLFGQLGQRLFIATKHSDIRVSGSRPSTSSARPLADISTRKPLPCESNEGAAAPPAGSSKYMSLTIRR